ncbi:MAG TPA: ATP-dependent DNA helicase Rep, partial [Gammaproteobacteria bacterium]|nr:ATP-dependent DNA helicase Rep [Gammaproteobacteria bacterium]
MSLDLNPPQQEAVRHTASPLLVLAGAGSGKTRVITRKIAHLIGERGIPPRHIAAVTFTNKAAREMKARVGKLLGQTPEGLRISTFHALGLDIIRREARHLGLRSGFSIYDNQDSANLIRDLMRRSFGDDGNQAERTQWRISAWKNDFLQPEQVLLEDKSDVISAAAMRVYADYNRHLRTYNAVDFDDLIMLPVLLFREHPEILDKWRSRIHYLLIDEYQDTNATQYELVRALVGDRPGLTVVGDDDQSIYAWRGARPENLMRLADDYPDLRVIKLEQNYRSVGRILRAANALIDNNPHVYEKRLWSELGYGDPIRVIRTANEEDEAERIVAELLHHRFQKGTRFGDYAILYRGNHQSRLFEKQLMLHNIPYYLSGGTSFFAYSEIKDIMAYLRLVTNPDDDNAFLRIVNTPRREIGPTSVEALARFAGSRHSTLLNACFDPGIHAELRTRAVNSIQAFAKWVVDMSQRVEAGESVEVVRDIIRDIRYETWLLDNCKEREDAERRMANVNDLVEWISRLSR